MLNIEHEDESLSIISAYAPNIEQARISFFKNLSTWINKNTSNPHRVIVCGDLNCALEPIDRNTRKVDKTSKHLKNVLKTMNLEDSFRFINKNEIKYTYSNSTSTFQSRIDFVLNSKYLNGLIKHASIEKVPMIPDHKAVIIILKLKQCKGKGYWILKTTWLQDQVYIQGITNLIIEKINEFSQTKNSHLTWDLCKRSIKEFSIKYAIRMIKIKNS